MPSEVVFAVRAVVYMTADEMEVGRETAESRPVAFTRLGEAESAGRRA